MLTLTLIPNTSRSPDAMPRAGEVSPLLKLALEPTGEGAYVDALREWIERVSSRCSPTSRTSHVVRSSQTSGASQAAARRSSLLRLVR